jgi:NhaP-type Na+/H+ or K+/H+ antiporter
VTFSVLVQALFRAMNLPLGTAVVGLVVGLAVGVPLGFLAAWATTRRERLPRRDHGRRLNWPSLLAGAMFNRRAALGDVMGMDAMEFAKASLRASQLNAGPPALSSGDGIA